MIKKIQFFIIIIGLNSFMGFCQTPSQIVFDWESAVENKDGSVSQTIDGLTVTVRSHNSAKETKGFFIETSLTPASNKLIKGKASDANMVTFTFSEFVKIRSIKNAIGSGKEIPVCYSEGPTTIAGSIACGALLALNINPVGIELKTFIINDSTDKSTQTLRALTNSANRTQFVFDDLIVTPVKSLSNIESIIQEPKIFPNPVKDILYIENIKNIEGIKLHNNLGQLLFSENNSNEIKMGQLPIGLYYLRVISKNGIIRKNIVKE